MADKLPQPTQRLVKRLQRVAKALEHEANLWLEGGVIASDIHDKHAAIWSARANTCWQAAGRLEELAERKA